jgi:23S rRNA (adenine-N6)-dimethyltransferase
VIAADLRNLRLPREPYRVIANPPFGLTTDVLAKLLDRPERGPERVDLIVQKEVATKLSARPPITLRAAAWAPWWSFTLGRTVGRNAFRPSPGVDAALLTITPRRPPVLPPSVSPELRELLRPAWEGARRRAQ